LGLLALREEKNVEQEWNSVGDKKEHQYASED
jgi:hypothetical protein